MFCYSACIQICATDKIDTFLLCIYMFRFLPRSSLSSDSNIYAECIQSVKVVKKENENMYANKSARLTKLAEKKPVKGLPEK